LGHDVERIETLLRYAGQERREANEDNLWRQLARSRETYDIAIFN
jgi:hypothetical protein